MTENFKELLNTFKSKEKISIQLNSGLVFKGKIEQIHNDYFTLKKISHPTNLDFDIHIQLSSVSFVTDTDLNEEKYWNICKCGK